MNTSHLRLVVPGHEAVAPQRRQPLGWHLVNAGTITPEQLLKALHLQLSLNAPLGEILVAEGWATEAQVQDALCRQLSLRPADFDLDPGEPDLARIRPAQFWLHHRALPWMRIGGTTLIATARPDRFDALREALDGGLGPVLPALCPGDRLDREIATRFAVPLARGAETRCDIAYSCRHWGLGHRLAVAGAIIATAAALTAAPVAATAALALLAVTTMAMFAALRLTAAAANLRPAPAPETPTPPLRRPRVSVLVPLYREKEIASALVRRLCRLSYPKALLEVLLVLEEHDTVTAETLARTRLPPWMRVIRVPGYSGLTTKPRAMNHALDFCRGEIVGVWDAEDAPAPDQIDKVVDRFATAPPDVVCLQGILDFYNPRSNWIARCFTLEYSAWFRVILPGIARLGLVVPLGGTTLFFRRDRLEELGGWDAHNVTEDAELGLRLCRAGWRTEMIDTTTCEEANCRPWPWIKQRSRWLKGFMVTYLMHMRDPVALWRDLGPARFLSVQAFYLGTLGQFLLAPLMWSFWLLLLGVWHPLRDVVPPAAVAGFGLLFLATELLAMTIAGLGVTRGDRRFLIPFVPVLLFYFPLGAIAAYKALTELVLAPHYWDKTRHGIEPAERSRRQR